MPNDGPAPPLPGPHQWAGREETEAGGPPAMLEGEDDGGTSVPDPKLDADPAPPPTGPHQGPGLEEVANGPPETFRPTALLSMLGLTYGPSAARARSAGPHFNTSAAVPALPFREA